MTIVCSLNHAIVSWDDGDDDDEIVSGLIWLISMGLLIIMSYAFIRRKYFEFFYRLHWILAVISIIFGFIHGIGLSIIGMVIWLIDLIIRLYIINKNKENTKNVRA